MGGVGDIGDDAERGVGAVHRTDLVDRGVDAILAQVGDDDACALVGEELRRGPTHTARSTGDDRNVAADRPRERRQARQRSNPPMPYCFRINARVGVTAMNAVSGELSGPPGANAFRS